jgi:hypothetical protein
VLVAGSRWSSFASWPNAVATLDPDQARALRVLRYWFGDLEVLAVLELEGVPGDTSPGLASQQLSLRIEAPPAHIDPPVKSGSSRPGCGRRRA